MNWKTFGVNVLTIAAGVVVASFISQKLAKTAA